MEAFLNSTWGIVAFLLGFGFIIFVHELGHFAVAKWVGIKCDQFSIGMGHAVLAWRKGIGFRLKSTIPEYTRRIHEYLDKNPPADHVKGEMHERSYEDETMMVHTQETEKSPYTTEQIDQAGRALKLGETEYKIGWIPLGGYVKMLGQDDIDPAHRSKDPRSFNNKSVGARMAVISAGVIMNLIFAMVFFIFAFMVGVLLPPAEIGDVMPGSPAAVAYAEGHEGNKAFQGLKTGDVVVEVDGEKPMDFGDIQQATALTAAGEPVLFVIQRPGHDELLRYQIVPERKEGQPIAQIGVLPPFDIQLPRVKNEEDVWPDYLKEAGITAGWRVQAINGQPVENQLDFKRIVRASGGQPLEFTFVDSDSKQQRVVTTAPLPLMLRNYSEEDTDADNGNDSATEPRTIFGFMPVTRISDLEKNSPAEKAGVRKGDLIAGVGSESWPSTQQVIDAVQTHEGPTIRLRVWRDNEVVDLGELDNSRKRLGVFLGAAMDSPILARQSDAAVPHDEVFPGGSRVLRVNDQPIKSYRELVQMMTALPADSESVELTIQPYIAGAEPETHTFALDAHTRQTLASVIWETDLPFPQKRVLMQTSNPVEAATMGFHKTRQTIYNVYLTLARIIDGGVDAAEMRGPLGIGHISIVIVNNFGLTFFIMFLGIISVNLAVINFLPIPIVDGGHMIFLMLEKIKGSPVSVRVQVLATYAGGALILMVFVFTFYNDVQRLIFGS